MRKNQNWNEQEAMMATAVVNIANTLPSVAQQMKQYVKTVQNGGGVINDGALQEMLDALSKMINANLHNVSQSRVNITLVPLSSNIPESKTHNKKVHLTESQLHNLIKKSVKRVLREHRQPITIGNNEYGEDKFYVEIGNADLSSRPFVVFAYNEQEALDLAVDYCEQNGMSNVFWDNEEETQEYPDEFITAGNHSHLLRSDCVIVRKAY